MADETVADDEALYDVWRRLEPAEVEALFERLDVLARRFFRQRGAGPTPAMRAEAAALRDSGLRLGHLTIIQQILTAP